MEPKWLEFDNLLLARSFALLEQGAFAHLHTTAQERFDALMKNEPDLLPPVRTIGPCRTYRTLRLNGQTWLPDLKWENTHLGGAFVLMELKTHFGDGDID